MFSRTQIIGLGGAIALGIGTLAALSPRSTSVSVNTLAIQSPRSFQAAIGTPASSESLSRTHSIQTSSISSNYRSVTISTCDGKSGDANFREVPALAPSVILGVVAKGDSVYLTGRMVQADGVDWYEAIAPPLYPSSNPSAQNQLSAGQVGWVASCFVDR